MRLIVLLLTVLTLNTFANTPEERARSLGLVLTEKSKPTSRFVYAVQTGNLLFISGHISIDAKGNVIKGKLGDKLTTEQGAAAARMAGISILGTIKQELGSLDKVKKFVKVTGMVNSTPTFTEHSQVMNGFSDLMLDVFGTHGEHARAAVGMASLPLDASVEIEAILEVE